MASKSQPHVALLSIQPEYANAIFTGEKSVEFRKQSFKQPVTHVVVYSSSPEQKILGYFEIAFVDVGHPTTIWRRYRGNGAIASENYRAYFDGKSQAVAYGIKKSFKLRKPISIGSFQPGLEAPQSFCYLEERLLKKLERMTHEPQIVEKS